MSNDSEHKNKGKAHSIVEKYKFSGLQNCTKEELISKIKELYNLQLQNEKYIAKQERQLENKETKINTLTEKLSVFDGTNDSLQKFVGYNKDWLYIDKITFVIERSNKPLTSHQIVDVLIQLEPTLKQRLLDPFKSITKAIYKGLQLNRIVRHYKTGNFGWTYVLPS
jgi:uncharacterized protein HemX